MLVVGLDLGTQSVKAVVCDDAMTVRGAHAVAISTAHPAPDHVEQDPGAWEAALGLAIAGALVAAGVHPRDIAALAITGQLDGCVAVDASGAPVHPALIWQDRRASAEAARISAAEVFAHTGQVADASHLAPKVSWLRAHGVRAARFHQPTSYLVERLTGEAVIDPSLASTTMLLDLASSRWSAPMLEAFALDAAELPEIRPTCAVAGGLTAEGARITGLVPGTRVAVGTGDDFTNLLGAGITEPGAIVCAIGTAEVVGALARDPVLDRVAAEPLVETHVFPTGAYLVEHPGWLCGGAVRWACELLGIASEAELDRLAARVPAGSGGVTMLPALAGAMTPVWRPHARATIHGLAAAHDKAHVARAVLEGLAFQTRDVVDRLGAMQLAGTRVVLVGGGARSRIWAQLRADVIGIPHHVAANVETSPLGAAMIATVAAGAHPDLACAARLVAAPGEVFVPVHQPALEEAYRRYRALGERFGLSAVV